jgi:nucleotide-binding universal stress UspA family protein
MKTAAHVVLATRFGAESEGPAAEARRLATLLGGGITVVYVATELKAIAAAGGEAGIEPTAQRAQQLESIREQLLEFVATQMQDMQVSVRVIEGDVATGVASVAAELNAAYLVVGTHGRSTLARLVLGDTTHAILQHSPCPVVVVPLGAGAH